MTDDPTPLEDDDWAAALTPEDYTEIVIDALDEAVDNLTEREIKELCRAVRQKIDRIAAEYPSQPTPAPDRWWDR